MLTRFLVNCSVGVLGMAPLCAAAGIGSGAPLTLVTGRVVHVATAAQL